MKRNFSIGLALSALILTCGCKKSIKSDSVDLSKGTKGGFVSNADWQTPSKYGRVIRFDVGDGGGSDCLLAWDISTGETSLTHITTTGSTTLYQNPSGLLLTNGGTITMTQYLSDCTDAYNEVGGVHIIPYDATGDGHEDHLLVYIPGRGVLWLIHWSNGQWVEDWYSSSGIGGYNLTNAYDKIITYDYGQGVMNYLILYRPGGGITWIMKNNSTSTNPNPSPWTWTTYLQSNSGIAGFDMKDPHDQLVTIGGPSNGQMDLCAYTPAFGYVWLIHHNANVPFGPLTPPFVRTSRTGLPGFSFASLQDRLSQYNNAGGSVVEDDNVSLCYRPGSGMSAVQGEEWNPISNYITNFGLPTGPGGLNYPMGNNPYLGTYTYIGDHVIPFSGQGFKENNSLLFYSNGGYNQSQIYYPASSGWAQAY